MLKLPKEFHPDFSVPGRKPVSGVEIDWSNPLAKGLQLVYIPQMNALFTIGADGRLTVVGDEPIFKINKNTVCAEHGLSDGSAVSTDSAYIANNAAKTSNEYTFVVRSRPNNSSNDGDYFSSVAQTFISNRSSSNKGFSYSQFGAVGGSPNQGRQQFTIHGLAEYTASAYNLNGSDFQTHGVSVSTSGDVGFYTDGQLKQSISVGSFTAGETNWLLGGQGPSASPISNRRCYSNIEFIFVYSRKLSDKEWHNVNKNPYQILKPANDLYLFVPSGGATYTLTPETGTFSLTGGVLSLLHNKSLSPGTGSITTSGGNVSLLYNRVITPETGSLSVTGNSINVLYNRQLIPQTGSFSLTGDPITLTYTPSGATYTLTPETGVFSATGGAVSLLHNKKLTPETGTLSVTGDSASLLYNRVLAPSTGSFALSGSAINLYANRQITLGTGTLSVTGSSITLTYSSAVVPNTPDSRTLSINAYARTLNANTRIRFIVADEQDRNL